MIELLLFLAHAYPGWTLLSLVILAALVIEAVPQTARALRGNPTPTPPKDKKSENDPS